MSSHVHTVPHGETEPLGSFLHRVNGTFGAWTNRRENGFGKVFAERPWSKVIETAEGLANTIAYNHNNPSRAGLVVCPSESDWTSHRAFIGLVEAPPWLDVAWTLAEIGFSSTPSGRMAFHDFVCSRSHMPRDPTLAGPGASSTDLAELLLKAAEDHFGCVGVARPGRDDDAAYARRVLIRTAVDVFGCWQAHVAEALGLSRSMLSKLHREAKTVSEAETSRLVETYLLRQSRVKLLQAG